MTPGSGSSALSPDVTGGARSGAAQVPDPDAPPPAPWRLRGEAVIVVAALRTRRARRFAAPAAISFVSAGGWTVGGMLLARYDERATLPYHELIVFSGLARSGRRPAFVVSHIYVDSVASLRGGRDIWGLPKELADFGWGPRSVTVSQGGRLLVRASVRRRSPGAQVRLPLHAPVFGDRGGATVYAVGRGQLTGTPGLVELDVPPTSPFAGLTLSGRHLALAGDDLDLRFPGGRVVV